jgi:hypothetical protein
MARQQAAFLSSHALEESDDAADTVVSTPGVRGASPHAHTTSHPSIPSSHPPPPTPHLRMVACALFADCSGSARLRQECGAPRHSLQTANTLRLEIGCAPPRVCVCVCVHIIVCFLCVCVVCARACPSPVMPRRGWRPGQTPYVYVEPLPDCIICRDVDPSKCMGYVGFAEASSVMHFVAGQPGFVHRAQHGWTDLPGTLPGRSAPPPSTPPNTPPPPPHAHTPDSTPNTPPRLTHAHPTPPPPPAPTCFFATCLPLSVTCGRMLAGPCAGRSARTVAPHPTHPAHAHSRAPRAHVHTGGIVHTLAPTRVPPQTWPRRTRTWAACPTSGRPLPSGWTTLWPSGAWWPLTRLQTPGSTGLPARVALWTCLCGFAATRCTTSASRRPWRRRCPGCVRWSRGGGECQGGGGRREEEGCARAHACRLKCAPARF